MKNIEYILNDCLNKAMCQKGRIQQPDSNKIAEFVSKYVEAEKLNLHAVVASLPSKKEIDFEANRQADFINIFNEKRQNLNKFLGFMNCVNWYAEKMKK